MHFRYIFELKAVVERVYSLTAVVTRIYCNFPLQIAVRGVTADDLMTALTRTPSSVTPKEVDKHENWNKQKYSSEI